jgi:uncharacterized heparinase superfamily protein
MFLRSANQILNGQLSTQILPDGAHFELSPMYHQIILGRLLDCYALVSANPEVFDDSILPLLEGKIAKMLGWIDKITFEDGSIPYLNDSAPNIANTTKELAAMAHSLEIQGEEIKLGASGYRKFEYHTTSGLLVEAVIDIGSIKANEQPGHTHSDIFSFVVSLNGSPLIVDTGISTYELCGDRYFERSTRAHNTVSYNEVDPIEVWKGFRVARRPKVTILKDLKNTVAAFHDGYRKLGILHHRTWIFGEDHIIVEDETIGNSNHRFDFNLHFHPSVKILKRSQGSFKTFNATLELSPQNGELKEFEFAPGYNQKEKATKLISSFRNKHRLKICFH